MNSAVRRRSQEKRNNPSKEWFETTSLANDKDGFLVNPDTEDIYWFHGNRQGAALNVPRVSETIYLSSMPSTAVGFACGGSRMRDFDVPLYQVKARISAERVFDVRRAVYDLDFRKFASDMLGLRGETALTSIQHALRMLHFEEYDYGFNEYPLRGRLTRAGYVAWLETEFVVDSSTTEEDLTLALLQEEALEDCVVDDVLYLSTKDCRTARSADRRARSVSELKQKLDI